LAHFCSLFAQVVNGTLSMPSMICRIRSESIVLELLAKFASLKQTIATPTRGDFTRLKVEGRPDIKPRQPSGMEEARQAGRPAPVVPGAPGLRQEETAPGHRRCIAVI